MLICSLFYCLFIEINEEDHVILNWNWQKNMLWKKLSQEGQEDVCLFAKIVWHSLLKFFSRFGAKTLQRRMKFENTHFINQVRDNFVISSQASCLCAWPCHFTSFLLCLSPPSPCPATTPSLSPWVEKANQKWHFGCLNQNSETTFQYI